jgi:hypothetical protein
MKEDLLQFIWQYKSFSPLNLSTTDGQPVKIVKVGERNTNSGPDFLNGQAIIGDTHWAGNIELHIKSSDWDAHKHTSDKAYGNVILHVVYEHNATELPANIPVLELKQYIPQQTLQHYEQLQAAGKEIPCNAFVKDVNDFVKATWLDRIAVERLESKSGYIKQLLERNRNDWQETTYQLVARNFGFKVNADAFEALAQSLPLRMLSRQKYNLLQVEALLFGQAGMLEVEFNDGYPKALQKEYGFLKAKYNLQPIPAERWKLLRLRPGNFPTYRIAQFAQLVYKSELLFSKFLEIDNVAAAKKYFDLEASEYWHTHYLFDKESKHKSNHKLGAPMVENIIINSIAPILFCYGWIHSNEKHKEKALFLLENLKAEHNSITKGWQALGMENNNAMQSQSLIQLKNTYCDRKRCLHCGIGTAILKPKL